MGTARHLVAKPQREFEAGCRMPSGATILQGDRLRCRDAKEGSRALYEAIERHLGRPLPERAPQKRNYTHHENDWHAEEDAALLRLRGDGLSYGDIARKMPKRTPDAVAARLRYLRAKGWEAAL